MKLKTINLLLLLLVTSINYKNAITIFAKNANKEIHEVTFKEPETTGEFPIESFTQIRVELLLELEQEDHLIDCPPNANCPVPVVHIPKTMVSSGVIVWANDTHTLVLTAGHSCDNKPTAPIRLVHEKIIVKTGHGKTADALIFKIDDEADLCLLSIEEVIGPVMPYRSSQPPLHTEVFAMASPLGLGSPFAIPVFEGRYFGDVSTAFSTYGFPSAPGSSGGPIFIKSGDLIGIITAVANGFHHFSIATTAKQTSSFLDKNIVLFEDKIKRKNSPVD